jgi:hypothetical protein
MADTDDDPDARGLIARSYSTFFKIRKRIRKVQDIKLPFRRGVGVEQFVTFFLVLIVLAILYGALFAPLFALTGIHLNWQMYLLYFLAPSMLAAVRVGKPMKSGKTIPGTVRSWLRKTLDDPVHRRGVPMRRRPVTGLCAHYLRVWRAHPRLGPYLPRGATYGDSGQGGVDLDAWLGETLTILAARPGAVAAGADGHAGRTTSRTRVLVPDDVDDDPDAEANA